MFDLILVQKKWYKRRNDWATGVVNFDEFQNRF